MRIAVIMPGGGEDYYCENCIRDGGLVQTLGALGHEAQAVSMYLPTSADVTEVTEDAPVFFGGINVYLQQHAAVFRHTPRWLDRMFDARGLLRWAGKRSGMTSARDLAETTLSMLRGEAGHQTKELERLVRWLADEARPDAVVLSNALLVGVVRRVREAVGARVVCLLQDEDGFLDSFPEPLRAEAWAEMAARAAEVDAFVAASRWYADEMIRRLALPPERVRVVHNGLDPEGYEPADEAPTPPRVGYLSPATPSRGLDLLVDAVARLRGEERFRDLRLVAAGGHLGADAAWVAELRRRIAADGLDEAVELLPSIDRAARQRYLRGLSVLCVPSRAPEAFGLFVLEALAAGVPVVLPRHGAFPELVEATGGGLLFPPGDPDALVGALAELLGDPARARDLGQAGRAAVRARFDLRAAGEALARVCAGGPEARP